jgi:predicted amidohydrolase YtcJ
MAVTRRRALGLAIALVALSFVGASLARAPDADDSLQLSLPAHALHLPVIGRNHRPSPSPTPTPTRLPSPDVIFYDGALLTMEGHSWDAEAIAIRGDLILAVVSDAEILALQGPQTEVVDLGGRTLLPGFIDSHSHWIGDAALGGFQRKTDVIQYAIEQGWTSISELFVNQERLAELLALDGAGQLRLRVNAYLPIHYDGQWFGHWYQQYVPRSYLSPRVHLAGIKIYVDHDYCRQVVWTQGELNAAVMQAHQAGWQVAIHATGEIGHQMVLDAFDNALHGQSNERYRHRIEHVCFLRDDQLQRMRDLGIIASIQLRFPGDLPQIEFDNLYACYGTGRLDLAFRYRDLLAAGVPTVGSTDWPWGLVAEQEGAPCGSPLRLLFNAATRVGTGVPLPEPWMLAQTLTVEQALPLLTLNGGWATFEENLKGSLAPGKWADLVILSENPLAVPVEELPNTQVLMTMIGGRVEYCAPGHESLCPRHQPGSQVVVAPGQAIQIAVVGPESGASPALVDLFHAMQATAHMAIEDHGSIGSIAIELVNYDDQCAGSGGISVASGVVANGQVVAVLGPVCSVGAVGGLPAYEAARIVVVSPSATRPDVPSYGPTVFNRTVLNDAQIIEEGLGSDAYIEALSSVQAFYTDYRNRIGQEPPASVRQYLAYTYDAAMILLRAIAREAVLRGDGALVIGRQALLDTVRGTKDYRGVTGAISFDSQGNRLPDSD